MSLQFIGWMDERNYLCKKPLKYKQNSNNNQFFCCNMVQSVRIVTDSYWCIVTISISDWFQ